MTDQSKVDQSTFSLSSFTFTKRLFSSSLLSAIRVVSSPYLRLLIFLLEILISPCASSSPVLLLMYSADQRRQWHTTPVLLPGKSHGQRSLESCGPWDLWEVRHDWATSLSLFTFHFHALEKEMTTHSSVLAWRIPGTGEPGGLTSMGLHRVGHDWSDLAAASLHIS